VSHTIRDWVNAAPDARQKELRQAAARSQESGRGDRLASGYLVVDKGNSTVDFVQMTPAAILGPLTDVERKHAPDALYLAGDLALLSMGPRVSVVGSRKASEEGLRRTRLLAKSLVDLRMVVVSGLAEGIDTAAHLGAIEAGGRTIGVLGTPLDRTYPEKNAALQTRIGREHLLVSQFAPGSVTRPGCFPMRNRTMALLTDATVIVEAGETSGTVHQGWEALRLGRQLFLLESVARDGSLTWPAKMIHYGAQVLTRQNLVDALSEIPSVTRYAQDELRAIA
jgi:DNA processing protein